MVKRMYVLLIALVLLLSSCSLGGLHMGKLFDTDRQTAKKKFEQILEVIQSQDENALKQMFSKKALADTDNIDGSIAALFDFYQGEVVSYNDWGGPGVDEQNEYGQKTKEIRSTYDVETNKQKYRFSIKEFTVDTSDPDNVGIYSFYVTIAKDTNDQSAYWGDGRWIPGITIEQK